MWVWWLLILVVSLLGIISEKKGITYNCGDVLYNRGNKYIFIFATMFLIILAGLRSTTGEGIMSIGDTRVYSGLFKNLVKDNIIIFFQTTDYSGDWGFYALMTIFHQLFGVNEQGLFFLCSLITIGCLMYRFYKMDLQEKGTLFFLFVTLGMYVSTMNGVRQWLVSAILFLIIPLIEKRRFIPYGIIILLLSTMHQSAIIYILLYFVVNKPAWGRVTKWMIFFTIFLFVSYPITGDYISSLLESSNYSQYSDMVISTGGGTNILRVAVYVVPLVLAYRYKNLIKKNKYYNIVINMAILDTLFMILALNNWIYARLCIYFDPFLLVVYLWDIKYVVTPNSKKYARILCVIFGIVYFWYQMYIGYGGQIYTSQILGIGV